MTLTSQLPAVLAYDELLEKAEALKVIFQGWLAKLIKIAILPLNFVFPVVKQPEGH